VVLNRTVLAREVAYLLDIPYRGRTGEAYRIVQATLQAITTALLEGKEIYIYGLGRFRLRTRGKRLKSIRYFPTGHRELHSLPPRQYVQFTPADDIVQTLNQPCT
jgi:nucleoid DNA-binding protein